ncbi:TPA: LysM peptidoglycan-binding domain-containing protein [Neisseria meningitidis]|uniref:FimV/HubP family polar landmark-like protein TspA n=1 Tax=Neisseria meningitidis TaxID=487 RepID=UPI00077A14A3|nr:FimV/HubP family polar landmark-like protein TspA [Neisseria meningitidis]MBR7235845.1 tspA protein [Neisseria meningitidis]MBW3892116.1 LysM peptidoglycan-binding domain-containing protein [Neisseria meningitidis]MCL5715340.1 FimV family protein [Neisseria meningitidis]RPC03297.1 tspA protein [Neisseria meningitidis]RPC12900.1 tspA protein [Neisseria meningitidis]
MKNNRQIKLIAASVAVAASFQAHAGLGGLNIQSNLDEPFSGSITVTGEEAKALLGGGSVTVSEKGLTAKVHKLGDKAVIAVSSAQAVRDPVLVFRIGAGAQVREYTAILDPVGYSPKTKSALSDGKTHRKTAPTAESQENQNAKALRKTDKKDSANAAVKPAYNGKTHTVRKGETVKQIAAAIRPKHLTLEQVADALLKANPNVSAHGRLRAGSVLHIPNLNRIKAEQPKPQTAKPKAETASMPSEPSKQATVEKPVEKPEAKVATPEAKAEKPAVRPEPVPAANTAASETAAESAPQEAAASAIDTPTDETGNAVSEPVEQVSAEEETESGLFGGSYTLLLAGGGAALIALLLLLRLAQSKRARRTEESVPEEEPDLDDAADDGIEITFAEVETPATPEPAPKNDVNDTLALDGESEEELSAKQTFDVETDTPSNRIDLDFDSLAAAQNGILSGALTQDEETQKRADADWNAIESTDSVYEPETFNPYNPVEIVIDTPEPESVAQTAENKPETVDTDFSDNLPSNNHIGTEETASAKPASPSGLAGFLKASSPETILEKTVAEVQTPEELHDFLKVYETDAVAETAPETPDFNAAADDLSALLQPAEAPAVEENVTETVADDLSALLQPFETPDVGETAAETVAETPDFNAAADDLSALLQPAEAPSVEENITETVAETPDFNATADDLSALLQPSEVPAVEENAAETVADDLSALLQPAEVPAVEENAAEITLETPDSNTSEADALPDFLKDGEEETVDWSIYLSEENIPNNADTSFPSESVGSDAPSEAKYDLAEMYLEIGDRDAAAETVQKLLEEAEGDVLKRAQALAQELGI